MPTNNHWDAFDTAAFERWVESRPELEAEVDTPNEPTPDMMGEQPPIEPEMALMPWPLFQRLMTEKNTAEKERRICRAIAFAACGALFIIGAVRLMEGM